MTSVLRALGLLVSLAGIATNASARAVECRGVDLMQRLRQTDPAFVDGLRSQGAAMPFNTGRLFRLDRDGLAPSWLFGTIHASDPRVNTPPPAARAALDGARSVVVEVATDPDMINPFAGMSPEEVRGLLVAPPEQRIGQLLSADDLTILEASAAEYGFPVDLVEAIRPSILTVFMAIPACEAKQGAANILDMRITRIAKDEGKAAIGLETLTEQLVSARDFPIEDQRKLIYSVVRYLPESENLFETLVDLYVKGEIGTLLAWARTPRPIPSIDAPVPPAFYEALLDKRNPRMAERALPILAKGGAFVAVGAAHLPGETGMLRLFEKAGYTVTRVE